MQSRPPRLSSIGLKEDCEQYEPEAQERKRVVFAIRLRVLMLRYHAQQ